MKVVLHNKQLTQAVTNLSQCILPYFSDNRDRRAIVLSDGSIEMVDSHFGHSTCRRSVYSAWVPTEHAKSICDTARPTLIINDSRNSELGGVLSSSLALPQLTCCFQSLIAQNLFVATEFPVLTPMTSAVVFFTSGSTGKPKGVELGRLGYQAWFEGIQECLNITRGDRVALTANHSFDLSLENYC